MNLEEELATLESQSTIMMNNNDVNNQVMNNQVMNNQVMNNPVMNNQNETIPNIQLAQVNELQQPQYQMPVQNQSAIMNQDQGFNFGNLGFDINSPQVDGGLLPRLAGQANETFRLHILPVTPAKIHIHYDEDQQHNFVCLKDVYGTSFEKCCITHGNAKSRNVIPVLVYPITQGNINMLIPNVSPELKVLIINDKKLEEIRQAASTVLGIAVNEVDLSKVDIIARVDNPQYKSHIFNCSPTTMVDQVKQFIPGLIERWNMVGTPENICKAAARLISREEYEAGYSNYNYRDHLNKQEPPVQGVAPGSYTFNTPISPIGVQQPYGMGGINQNQPFYGNQQPQQPFYNGQQSQTVVGQNNIWP